MIHPPAILASAPSQHFFGLRMKQALPMLRKAFYHRATPPAPSVCYSNSGRIMSSVVVCILTRAQNECPLFSSIEASVFKWLYSFKVRINLRR